MKIVGITSCTVGIAHTYMAREKLIQAGKKLGIEVKIEAQGSAGIEFALTPKDIEEADAVLIASDVSVAGKERFKGKPMIEVPISMGIKSPEKLLTQIKTKLGK
jgi:fructose PTS system EIIB component